MDKLLNLITALLLFLILAHATYLLADENPSIISKAEIFKADEFFNSCHASTVLETKSGGSIVAYFAGSKEGAKDVCIWLSKFENNSWQNPKKIIYSAMTSGKEEPCWNPVLFRLKSGRIILFFKQAGNWKNWKGMQSFSDDEGETWSKPEALQPDGNAGPIKNKPVYVGTRIIAPTSDEPAPTDWRVYFWISDDDAKTWKRTDYVNTAEEIGGIQPSILIHKNGYLQAVGRTPKTGGYVYQTWSKDGGITWSKICSTGLPNPNSGTDAITLKDGRHLLIYNHTSKGRSPLNLAISDDGIRWFPLMVLEDSKGEYSYPAIIQRENGLVELTYTNKRKTISHALLDPSKFAPGKKMLTQAWEM